LKTILEQCPKCGTWLDDAEIGLDYCNKCQASLYSIRLKLGLEKFNRRGYKISTEQSAEKK